MDDGNGDGVSVRFLVTTIVAFIVFVNQIIIILAMCSVAFNHDLTGTGVMVGVGSLILVITSAIILMTSLVIVCVLVCVMFVSAVVMLAISFCIFIRVVSRLSNHRKQVKLKYFDVNDTTN